MRKTPVSTPPAPAALRGERGRRTLPPAGWLLDSPSGGPASGWRSLQDWSSDGSPSGEPPSRPVPLHLDARGAGDGLLPWRGWPRWVGVAPVGETRGGIPAACRPVRRGRWPRRGRRRRDGVSGSSASGDPCPGRQRVAKRPSRRRRRGGPRRHTHKEARGRGLWQAWRPWGQLTSRSARCPPGAPQKKKGGVAPSGQVVSKARWAQVPKACR